MASRSELKWKTYTATPGGKGDDESSGVITITNAVPALALSLCRAKVIPSSRAVWGTGKAAGHRE